MTFHEQPVQHPELTLKLERPVCFLDVETTGVDVEKDRIVELSILKLFPDGLEYLKSIRINPGISIPKEASDIHGITDDLVKDLPKFEAYSKGIFDLIQDSDIVGYNSNRFDVPFIFYSLKRAGVDWDWKRVNLIDVCSIFKIKEERTLAAAVKFYIGKDHEGSHTAEGDVQATRAVFLHQLARYADLPKDFKDLALFSNWGNLIVDMAGKFTREPGGEIIFNFGKHKGKVAKSERGYLFWMKDSSEFSSDTKKIVNYLLFGKY